MNVSEAIRTKRAIRQFSDQPVPKELILEVVNAGRRSQSSKNTQPWEFIIIQDKSLLKALSECGTWASHIEGAAFAIAILTPDPTEKFQTMFDAGQSAACLQLAAWDLGIGSCPASIYEPEKARDILGFPENLHLRIVLSLGYPVIKTELTAPPKKGGRRSLNEMVHWDKWQIM